MQLLEKTLTLNLDYKTRDAIIAEFPRFDDLNWKEQSIFYFDITPDILNRLIELKFADPEEKQNDAPRIRDFSRLASYLRRNDQNNDIRWITLEGYATSPERPDYRISIDGISIDGYFDDKLLLKLIKFGLNADELTLTRNHFRAWWD